MCPLVAGCWLLKGSVQMTGTEELSINSSSLRRGDTELAFAGPTFASDNVVVPLHHVETFGTKSRARLLCAGSTSDRVEHVVLSAVQEAP